MLSAHRFFLSLAAAGLGLLLTAQTARAEYTYIHSDGEYSILLPDAPSGETIWFDRPGHIPFIENRPKFGSLGEFATVRRTDEKTGDSFNVDITFVKSGRDYLLTLNEEDINNFLEKEYSNQKIENKKISYSPGTGTLKWGSFTGFSVDRDNNLMFHSCHVLTGLETITMIKMTFNAENEEFGDIYQKAKDSIKFVGTK